MRAGRVSENKTSWKTLKRSVNLRRTAHSLASPLWATPSKLLIIIRSIVKTKLLITVALSFPSSIFRLLSQVYREHGNAKTLFLILKPSIFKTLFIFLRVEFPEITWQYKAFSNGSILEGAAEFKLFKLGETSFELKSISDTDSFDRTDVSGMWVIALFVPLMTIQRSSICLIGFVLLSTTNLQDKTRSSCSDQRRWRRGEGRAGKVTLCSRPEVSLEVGLAPTQYQV